MYMLSKIVDFPEIGAVLSAIKTDIYKWVKFFVPLPKPITSNSYTVKAFFDFVKGFYPRKF